MKSFLLKTCVALGVSSLAFVGASVGHATSFTNGDFETPNIGNTFYTTYGNGDTSITGWTVSAPGVATSQLSALAAGSVIRRRAGYSGSISQGPAG